MAAIYVSGFDRDTDEDILKKHFGKVGQVKELYFQSMRSAVITYEKAGAADRAVAELHETTMKGQERYVAVHLDVRSKGGGGNGSSGGAAVYASGFDYDTDEVALKKHFGKAGKITDLYFQSNGSAVITYADAGGADRAVAEIDGTTMKGQQRYVAVKLDDRDRKTSKGAGKGKGKGKSGKSGKTSTGKTSRVAVYASGFDYDTDEISLKKHFGKVGRIEELYFQSKGSAVITYEKADAADRAVAELDGSTMKGQERYVAVHLDKRGKSR